MLFRSAERAVRTRAGEAGTNPQGRPQDGHRLFAKVIPKEGYMVQLEDLDSDDKYTLMGYIKP